MTAPRYVRRVPFKEAALRLGQWFRLHDVAPADVRDLAERGLLPIAVRWGVELVPDLPPDVIDELRRVGDERRAWRTASLDCWAAADRLGVSWDEVPDLAAEHGLQPGRFGRYARSDVERLRLALLVASATRLERAG